MNKLLCVFLLAITPLMAGKENRDGQGRFIQSLRAEIREEAENIVVQKKANPQLKTMDLLEGKSRELHLAVAHLIIDFYLEKK